VLRWLQSPADCARLRQRFAELGTGLRRQASERAADVVLGLLPGSYNRQPSRTPQAVDGV
jgi:hypothetical protein